MITFGNDATARRVSLPMYDLPGLQAVWDAWWRGICTGMMEAGARGLEPELTRFSDLMAHWRDPSMQLSQTCGYPYKLGLELDWRLLATPIYDVEWCEGPRYRNLVLVRRDDTAAELTDLRGRRVGYNSTDSHSGYNSIRSMVAPLARGGRFFGDAVETGGHLACIRALASGEIDCCSVDCVTYALIEKHDVAPVDGLRVLAAGPLVPGLPFVVPRRTADSDVEEMRHALLHAVARPVMAPHNSALLLRGFAVVPEGDYTVIIDLDRQAAAADYTQMR